MKTGKFLFSIFVSLFTITFFSYSALAVTAPYEPPSLLTPGQTIPAVKNIPWPEKGETFQSPTAISIIKGTSQVFRFDRTIKRISVSDPDVCDVLPLGVDEFIVHAKETGHLNLVLWDDQNQIATYDVESIVDYHRLSRIVKKIDPKSDIEIVPFADNVAVMGYVSTIEKIEQIEQAAKAFDQKILVYLKVEEPKQILLEVRFAEVDRTSARDFGFDGSVVSRWWTGEIFTGQNNPARDTSLTLFTPEGGVAGQFPFGASSNQNVNAAATYVSSSALIQGYLDWLINKSILKLIARPNLLAKDGEEASFVVGGEVPYITTTANNTNVQYKEFGTRLKFTPNILDNGVIHLAAETEVSELDFLNTVQLQGTSAPTIIKTEHKTVAELKEGETLVIGGVLTQRISRAERKLPILGDIPYIQKLFRRESFSRKDVELLIVITPHLISPTPANPDRQKTFPPELVNKAVEVFSPSFPDEQADAIAYAVTRGENYQDFPETDKDRVDDVAKELSQEFLELDRVAAFTGVTRHETNIIKKVQKEIKSENKMAHYIDLIYEIELKLDKNGDVEAGEITVEKTYQQPQAQAPQEQESSENVSGDDVVWEEMQSTQADEIVEPSESSTETDADNDSSYEYEKVDLSFLEEI